MRGRTIRTCKGEDAPLYRATLSGRAKRSLILNGVGASLLSVLAAPQALAGGHWLHLLIVCVAAPIAVLAVVIFVRARHPLEVHADRIVTTVLTRKTMPFVRFKEIAGDEVTIFDIDPAHSAGGVGESRLSLPWPVIAEPKKEVIAEVARAQEVWARA